MKKLLLNSNLSQTQLIQESEEKKMIQGGSIVKCIKSPKGVPEVFNELIRPIVGKKYRVFQIHGLGQKRLPPESISLKTMEGKALPGFWEVDCFEEVNE